MKGPVLGVGENRNAHIAGGERGRGTWYKERLGRGGPDHVGLADRPDSGRSPGRNRTPVGVF